MALPLYLAMTGAEMTGSAPLPGHFAYMACQFSPFGTGLSNLPPWLPEGSLLILNDQMPLCGHEPRRILEQLTDTLETWNCRGLLLDFERPESEEAAALAAFLQASLPRPVAMPPAYGRDLDCPVFLPPVPPDVPLEAYLAPWQAREIWLEVALDGLELTLTESGCTRTPLPWMDSSEEEFRDEKLHCHYRICMDADSVKISLRRTREDLDALLAEAAQYGVTTAVGLWQEFR